MASPGETMSSPPSAPLHPKAMGMSGMSPKSEHNEAMQVDAIGPSNGGSTNQVKHEESTDTTPLSSSIMAPPPPPPSASTIAVAARSSGRVIKPTLKLRGDDIDDDEGDEQNPSVDGHAGSSYPSIARQRRQTTTTNGSNASSNGSFLGGVRMKAPRLKLNVRGGITHRGKDPNALSGKKNAAYMDGYDRELDSSDDETGQGIAFEEQLILRMPEDSDATRTLQDWVRKREVGSDGREVEMKFKDSRRAFFKVGDRILPAKLVDLPSIIESHKTLDNRQVFKIADISQMLLVSEEIRDEIDVTQPEKNKGNFGSTLRDDTATGDMEDFIYEHGITPPMRYARKRRFRKRAHKRTIETVEKEVERLLAEDARADEVENVMIDLAEAELDDSDAGAASPADSHDEGGAMSMADTPREDGDSMSMMGDVEGYDDDGYSQMGDGTGGSVMADDDVDLDLQRELEAEFARQNSGADRAEEEGVEEDEEDDEDDSSDDGRTASRGRSASRASDDDFEDDLFDADAEEGEEGAQPGIDDVGGTNEDEDEEDDDEDEEEREQRVREQQLEAECKEIDSMVRKKQIEVDGAVNLIMKQRNGQSLRRLQTELDMKRGQLITLKQQRREGKEAKKAEAQAAKEAAQATEALTASVANGGSTADSTDDGIAAVTVETGADSKLNSVTGSTPDNLTPAVRAVPSTSPHRSSSKAASGESGQPSTSQSTLPSSKAAKQGSDPADDQNVDIADGDGEEKDGAEEEEEEDDDDGDEDEEDEDDEDDDDPLFGGA